MWAALVTGAASGYVRTPLVENQVPAQAHGVSEEAALDDVILAPTPSSA